jgi:hypothetical protein
MSIGFNDGKGHNIKIKKCPFCGSDDLEDCYVFIQCKNCKTEGPKTNNGNYDDHADWVDHENAVKLWNKRIR